MNNEVRTEQGGKKLVMPGNSQFYKTVTQQRMLSMLKYDLGPIAPLLDDPAVTEITANSDGSIWVDRVGEGRAKLTERMEHERALAVITNIASAKGETVDERNPSFDAIVPGHGFRFIGLIPPQTPGPTFTIRKKPERVISLDEYENAGIITAAQKTELIRLSIERENLIIAGGTGSGKTTLANAILQVMARTGHRIITIEDTPELQNSADDQESMYTVSKVRGMQDCLRDALRMHPDRLVFGEVRGAEVRDMLMAWNTGHRGGLCTLHCDSAQDGLLRIEEMLETIPNYYPKRAMIARAINVIVFIHSTNDYARYPAGRYVKEIVRVTGVSAAGDYELRHVS